MLFILGSPHIVYLRLITPVGKAVCGLRRHNFAKGTLKGDMGQALKQGQLKGVDN